MPARRARGSRRASRGRASAAAARRRESPEWMPASSTCCMIPPIQTSSPSHSASTSTSIAFSRKRSRKISRPSRAVAGALEVVGRPSRRVDDLHRPAAEHVATGARAAGSRPRSPRVERLVDRRARSRTAAPGSRAARAASPKRPRSSARSIASTLVPSSGTPASLQAGGELQRRLAAELDDDALGLLDLDDAEHVLERQRLEVQAVGGVVVGRDRLGVAVDHHRVAARLADGHRRVHAAVVELDALADAVRARAEDHDRRRGRRARPRGRRRALPARVVVRRRAANSAAQVSTALNERSPANGASGSSASARSSRRNHGSIAVRAWTSSIVDAAAERLEQHVVAVGGRALEARRAASSTSTRRARRRVELARAHRLGERLLEGAADRHGLPHRLHVGRQLGVGAGELLEREARPLDDDVVDRRLEARRRDAA